MMSDLILTASGLLALCAAAISDIRTREVPDWISYGLIVTGFSVRIFHAIAYAEADYVIKGMIGFVVMFVFGNIMFYTRQWGGGDAKLMMGMGVVFATRPSYLPFHNLPFLLIVVINVFIIGAIYGIVYGIVLAVKNKKRFIEYARRYNRERKTTALKITALMLAGGAVIITASLPLEAGQKFMIGSLALLMLIYPYLAIFIKAVERGCLIKEVPAKKLTPGDWVEQDVYKKGKLVYKKNYLGIEKRDIQRLVRAKVGRVVVKEGIPFIPPFFIGAALAALTGKILFLV